MSGAHYKQARTIILINISTTHTHRYTEIHVRVYMTIHYEIRWSFLILIFFSTSLSLSLFHSLSIYRCSCNFFSALHNLSLSLFLPPAHILTISPSLVIFFPLYLSLYLILYITLNSFAVFSVLPFFGDGLSWIYISWSDQNQYK